MPKQQVTVQQKQAVIERAKGCCEYCRSQARFATQGFSVEHIQPTSKEGQSTLDNLALACQGCNNHKYNKTEALDPVTGKIFPLFNPREQRWLDHFAWNEDYTLILGLTATGRSTVESLRLNREGLVNLRRILYKMGEHPPSESK
ncbi:MULTISPECIES: HNH endonuclease [Planktothricoides]|uniref:HNH endonuclease signature motif containing protein n=2 Tax=Planktothricoides raciborskii TaxID=132608 RepID=A0AAU8JL59_9CYAN|nr:MULTISPECIES: HNH endonuclease signature motif containing protein [Planktothricoides]KOR38129.1 HNH endonuclease [Planktothricoides sp. SR001]MBD2542588.1 HNH endonuclease [Planktothricoides raciborskii FACHB-1370]MBD2581046.1 HNH endonuclease [Planktothricoides raciborskii FACHB-1261]